MSPTRMVASWKLNILSGNHFDLSVATTVFLTSAGKKTHTVTAAVKLIRASHQLINGQDGHIG